MPQCEPSGHVIPAALRPAPPGCPPPVSPSAHRCLCSGCTPAPGLPVLWRYPLRATDHLPSDCIFSLTLLMPLSPVFWGFYPAAPALLCSWNEDLRVSSPCARAFTLASPTSASSSASHSATSCAHGPALGALPEEILRLFCRELFLLSLWIRCSQSLCLFPDRSGSLLMNHKNPLWLTETEKEFSERLLRANEGGLVSMEGQAGEPSS